MNYLAYLLLIGSSSAIESAESGINFSYMKKDIAATDDYSILGSISNWFSGDADNETLDHKYQQRHLAQWYDKTGYQLYDDGSKTVYNYQYTDQYNYAYGINYNFYTNVKTTAVTTNSVTVNYYKAYIAPTYVTVTKDTGKKPATTYKKSNTGSTKKPATTNKKTTTTTVKKSTYVAPPKAKDGEACSDKWDCVNTCCSKNIVVMPEEGV